MQTTSSSPSATTTQNFHDQVVCITGARGGIGRVIAQMFAQAGASVWAMDLPVSPTTLQDTANPSDALATKIQSVSLDVRNQDQWQQAIERVLIQDQKIDILIQCASIVQYASIESTSLSDWRDVLQVNLDGVFLGIKTVLPIMKKQRSGVMLQIGSYLASRPMPGLASYCVSKAAVETLTKTAALEAAAVSPNIRVNAILPGGVKTDIWKAHPAWKQLMGIGKSESAAFQALASTTPQKRFAEPEEIAQLALFLASDAARFVTGALWSIDGGITA